MTATATSSRRAFGLAGLALVAVLAFAGCGGAGSSSGGASTRARPSGAFAWLSPAAPPSGWTMGKLPTGRAAFAYPPGWRPIKADPGTFSAALMGAHGLIVGYLNATPRQGEETLADWAHFRTDHNRDEGDFTLVSEAAATGLRFRTGLGSCVIDRYATVRTHYREIACLVRGARASTVIVGAALPRDWPRLAPQLERSISSFAT